MFDMNVRGERTQSERETQLHPCELFLSAKVLIIRILYGARTSTCSHGYINIYWNYVKIIIIFFALFAIRINRTRKRVCLRISVPSAIRMYTHYIRLSIHSPIRPFIARCINISTQTQVKNRAHDVCIECIHLPHWFVCHRYYLSFTCDQCGTNGCMQIIWWSRNQNQNHLQHIYEMRQQNPVHAPSMYI